MHINGIDEKDNEIINLLLKDARMSYSDIGEKVGLSRTAVKNRIAALEKSGYITGYRAVVNPVKSTEMITYMLNIETSPASFESAKEVLVSRKEVQSLVQTTGRCHLTAICLSCDMQSMKDFVNELYKEIPDVEYINSSVVIDELKGSIISA